MNMLLHLGVEAANCLLDRYLKGITMGHQPKKPIEMASAEDITIFVIAKADVPKQENYYRSES
jgi:hypothetical protein